MNNSLNKEYVYFFLFRSWGSALSALALSSQQYSTSELLNLRYWLKSFKTKVRRHLLLQTVWLDLLICNNRDLCLSFLRVWISCVFGFSALFNVNLEKEGRGYAGVLYFSLSEGQEVDIMIGRAVSWDIFTGFDQNIMLHLRKSEQLLLILIKSPPKKICDKPFFSYVNSIYTESSIQRGWFKWRSVM